MLCPAPLPSLGVPPASTQLWSGDLVPRTPRLLESPHPVLGDTAPSRRQQKVEDVLTCPLLSCPRVPKVPLAPLVLLVLVVLL